MSEQNATNGRRNDFEKRLQSIAQAIILAILIGIGASLISLMKSASQQEIINFQTSKDVAELKAEIMQMRNQNTANTAAALAAVTTATAAALASSTAVAAAAAAAGKAMK